MNQEPIAFKCPKCSSAAYKKNGFNRHGNQNHKCLECGRQFVGSPRPPLAPLSEPDVTPAVSAQNG